MKQANFCEWLENDILNKTAATNSSKLLCWTYGQYLL